MFWEQGGVRCPLPSCGSGMLPTAIAVPPCLRKMGKKNQRCSQHSIAAHRGSNFPLIPLTHNFISQCLGSGYLYLSQKTVVVIKGNLLLFLLKNFIMRF